MMAEGDKMERADRAKIFEGFRQLELGDAIRRGGLGLPLDRS